MMVKYVIIQIGFEDKVSDGDIFDITSKFYSENEKNIRGMKYDLLKSKKVFEEFKKIYEDFSTKKGE